MENETQNETQDVNEEESREQPAPDDGLPVASLADLPESLQSAVREAGWSELMPVQERAIPYIRAGRDVMVQSRTGSGKTGAFVLPILERIDPQKATCQALVLVPTRELCRQVAEEARLLARDTGCRTLAVYGGVGYGEQLDALAEGAHLVVGTPGRVLDHLLKGALSLQGLDMLVFDEADRMLSMGFYPDMKQIQRYLPDRRVTSSLFSATYPAHVLGLAHQFLVEPEMLSLSSDHVHVTDTEHVYYVCQPMDKDRALVRIIEIENPESAFIFCNTRQKVHYVAVVLQRFGYDADELSSDLSQGAREKILSRVRKGELRFLVATDVAARGIDIPDLSHVFLYDTPEDHEDYIHRAGRTGRAGASGTAISLVSGMEEIELGRIAKRYEIDLEQRPQPEDKDVETIVTQRVTALLEARLRGRDRLQVERMKRFIPLGRELAESEDESAIIAMLLDDFYQQSLHAKPVPSQEAAEKPAARREEPKSEGRSGGSKRGGGRRSGRRGGGRSRR